DFGDDRRETGYTPPDHDPDAGHELLGAVIGIGPDHFEAAGVRAGFDGPVDVEEERVLHVGDDHPNRSTLAAREAAGMQVGMVLQLLDGAHHAGAGGVLDDARVVEHARHRGGGHLGAPGHLFEVHG